MTLQYQENSPCVVEVNYVADMDKVASKRKEAADNIRRSKVPVPGFRPGKAPDWAIHARLKSKVDDWVKRELVSQAYDETLFQTKMKPIGYPKILRADLHDYTFQCNLTFYRKPDLELKKYKGFEIPRPHRDKSVSDVAEQMIQDLRLRNADIKNYTETDFVQNGDRITMDFTCTMDGKVFEDGSKKGILYSVGEGYFQEFDDNLYGMKVGEEKTFDATFGENSPDEIKGKTATFKVHIHAGMKVIPHALDDELAKKVGMETFDALRARVEAAATNRLDSQESAAISQQLIKKLLAEHEVQIPSWLVNSEAQSICSQNGINWQNVGQEQKDVIVKQAESNVKLALIMDSIREVEPETVFSDGEILNIIKTRVKESGQDPDKFLVESQKTGALFGMVESIRSEVLLQWLVKQSTVVE